MAMVMRKLPAVLAAVIVAAALALAAGVITTQAVYADDVQLDKILCDGDGEWGHRYAVDSKDAFKTLEELNITVLDKDGQVVPGDKYDLQIFLTYFDEVKDEDIFIPITDNKFGLMKEDMEGDEGGFTQYQVRAEAKDGSGYKGEAEPVEFFITHKYSLNYICPKIEFNDYVEASSWRMHLYYVVPVDKVQDVVVHGSDGSLLTKDADYKASYYVRGDASTDDWGEIWSEKNPVEGLPSKPGNYFVKVEGIDPYYGGEVVNLDVIDGSSSDPSEIKYVKAKATKKKPYVVKASKVKKAKQTVSIKKLVKSDVPLFRYEKAGGSKNLSILQGKGKVVVKKGTKKGTYSIKIKVWPSGTNEYLLGDRTVTCYIKVK